MGFTKLFSGILASSVWCEDHPTVRIWIGMLALANSQGVVEGSIPGLANICRVTVDECKKAIEILSSPDHYSRNPSNEGRRIEPHLGGWKILNYLEYRDRGQDKDGSRADYFRRYRSQHKNVAHNTEMLHDTQKQKTEAEEEKDLIYKPAFESFWKEYPQRNGKKSGKAEAQKEWDAIKPSADLIKIILSALKKQKENFKYLKDTGEFAAEFPDACRWLKKKRWEDEVKDLDKLQLEKVKEAQ